MQKILNYITNGQGLGIKFLLLLSLIASIILAIFIRVDGKELIPYAQQIADQMLPIKVDNGTIVEPIDTYKVAHITVVEGKDIALPVVLNTQIDTLSPEDFNKMTDGVYVTKTMVYAFNKGQTKITPLTGSFDFPLADYTQDFKSWLTYTSILVGIAGIFGLFILYFVLSLFYGLCAQLITIATKRKLNFNQRMRLAVVSFISSYIIVYLLERLTTQWNSVIFFIIVIAIESFLIVKLPKSEATADSNISEKSTKEKEE